MAMAMTMRNVPRSFPVVSRSFGSTCAREMPVRHMVLCKLQDGVTDEQIDSMSAAIEVAGVFLMQTTVLRVSPRWCRLIF